MRVKKQFCIYNTKKGQYVIDTLANSKQGSIDRISSETETGFSWKELKKQGYEVHEVTVVKGDSKFNCVWSAANGYELQSISKNQKESIVNFMHNNKVVDDRLNKFELPTNWKFFQNQGYEVHKIQVSKV